MIEDIIGKTVVGIDQVDEHTCRVVFDDDTDLKFVAYLTWDGKKRDSYLDIMQHDENGKYVPLNNVRS